MSRYNAEKWNVLWPDGKTKPYSQAKLRLAESAESATRESFKRRSLQISTTILQLALKQNDANESVADAEPKPKPVAPKPVAPKPKSAKPKLKFRSKAKSKLKKSKAAKKQTKASASHPVSGGNKVAESPDDGATRAKSGPKAVATRAKSGPKAAAPAKSHSRPASSSDKCTSAAETAPQQDMWADANPPTVFGRCNWDTLVLHLSDFGKLGEGKSPNSKSDALNIFYLVSRLAMMLKHLQQSYSNSVDAIGHAVRQICEIVVLCLDDEGLGGADGPSATDLVLKGDIPAAVARLRNRGANVDICTLLVEPAELEKVDKFDATVECLWALGQRTDHVFLPDFRVTDKATAIGSVFRCACAVSQSIRARHPQEWARTAPRVKAAVVMVKVQFFCVKLEEEPTALVTVVKKEWSGDFPPVGTRVDMRIGRRMEKNPRNGRWKFSIGLDVKRI